MTRHNLIITNYEEPPISEDLVKRLRRTVTEQDTEGEKYEVPINLDGPIAADRIEALQARVAELEAELKEVALSRLAALGQEADAAARAEAAEARVAELEAALEDADEGCRYMHLYEKEDRG